MLSVLPQQIMNFLLVKLFMYNFDRHLAGLPFQILYKIECLVNKSILVGIFYS